MEVAICFKPFGFLLLNLIGFDLICSCQQKIIFLQFLSYIKETNKLKLMKVK